MDTRNYLSAAALAFSAILVTSSAAPAPADVPQAAQAPVTTAVIATGGGAGGGSFSSVRAFSQMMGSDALQNELRTLRDKYGSDNVDNFVRTMDFAFIDGWKRAGEANVKMPTGTPDSGSALALDMIRAGTGTDHVFRITAMMDALWSPRVHAQIRNDIQSKYGSDAVTNFVRVGNQFFYDIAHSLGNSSVTLAPSQ
jgi:hypothetical protein